MTWTTSDTRYESAGIFGIQDLCPIDSIIQDDSILDEKVHLSDDEDSENDHLPKADSRKNWWKPLPEEERSSTLEPAWTIPFSSHVTIQTQLFFNKDLEYLRYGSKSSSLALSISKMKAASYLDIDITLRRVKKKSDHTYEFPVSSELKPTQDTGYEFKHDYTIIESPRALSQGIQDQAAQSGYEYMILDSKGRDKEQRFHSGY
nr:hypothetical protein [Tanacetum cinerariifolium]